MFVGHYGVALALASKKARAPRLGTLFIGVQLIDIAFFSFLPLGVEKMRVVPGYTAMNPMDLYAMPYTHSLIGACAWALAFALLIGGSGGASAALVAGASVLSHWLLDLLVHAPDLTLWGAPPRFGLGLWNHPLIEMPLEIGLLLLGALAYARRTTARRRGWALPLLIGYLLLLQAINWFGPPPADPLAPSFWGVALFAYLSAAALAAWTDRNRAPAATD